MDYFKLNATGLHLAWFVPIANMGLFPREEYEQQFSPAINVPYGLRSFKRQTVFAKIAPISYSLILIMPLLVNWKGAGFSFASRIFMWLAPIALSSLIFLCYTQVSHVQPEVQVAEDHPHEDFFLAQAQLSVDYSCESKFWNIMSGGLNTQSLHHVCPNLSSCHYTEVFPKFEKICNKHGVQIPKRRNLCHAITSCFGHIWKINKSTELVKALFEKKEVDKDAAKKEISWKIITVVQQSLATFSFVFKGDKKN